jgi:hypothetical protein
MLLPTYTRLLLPGSYKKGDTRSAALLVIETRSGPNPIRKTTATSGIHLGRPDSGPQRDGRRERSSKRREVYRDWES